MILYVASWGAPRHLASATAEALSAVARWFPGLESLRGELATQCLDCSASPLWDIVERAAFSSMMLDDEALPAREQAAETLLGIVTLFEYEQLRSTAANRT
jgi:hypothetical protein